MKVGALNLAAVASSPVASPQEGDMKLKRHSKTIWFNWIVSSAVIVATALVTYLPQYGLDPSLSSKIMTGLVLLVTFGNKYLRTLTKDALK